MQLVIGSDHAGFNLKQHLVPWLEKQGHKVLDVGPATPDSVDYPDFAATVARAVANGTAEQGILVCGSGIGVAIAANKIAGIRAAQCYDLISARLSRQHNDANIITLGERLVTPTVAEEILSVWLTTAFEGGRHSQRITKIHALEAPDAAANS